MTSRHHSRAIEESRFRSRRLHSRSRSPAETRARKSDHHRDSSHHYHRHHDSHRRGHRDTHAYNRLSDHRELPEYLPFGAKFLSASRDLESHRGLLATYLDAQKHIDIHKLNEREVKGRWKSFVKKWNHGELDREWYESHDIRDPRNDPEQPFSDANNSIRSEIQSMALVNPSIEGGQTRSKHGPSMPSFQDLDMERETDLLIREASNAERQRNLATERSLHNAHMQSVIDEVAPRAEPGTRERQLEKKRETADANRAFAESRQGGSPGAEADDETLMGEGGGNDYQRLVQQRETQETKKSERELRRQRILLARAAEREERMEAYRKREDKTMSVLKALARERYGPPPTSD